MMPYPVSSNVPLTAGDYKCPKLSALQPTLVPLPRLSPMLVLTTRLLEENHPDNLNEA